MTRALIFVFETFADLYLAAFLLRFLLQWVRADYYNPLSQLILRVTAPLVVPARRFIPSVGGVDVPTLIVLVALEFAVTWVIDLLLGARVTPGLLTMQVVLRLIALVLHVYIVAILLYAILSFLGDRGRGPVASVLDALVHPVLRPVRRVLPPIGGFDLSPLVVIVLLQAILIALGAP
jgi:YggT family protein